MSMSTSNIGPVCSNLFYGSNRKKSQCCSSQHKARNRQDGNQNSDAYVVGGERLEIRQEACSGVIEMFGVLTKPLVT